MFNKVFTMGIVAGDPAERTTPSGASIIEFTLLVNGGYYGKDGKFVEREDRIPFVSFGKSGEKIREHIASGMLVSVEGKLSSREWKEKTYIDAVALNVTPIDWKPSAAPTQSSDKSDESSDDKSDLPF